MKDLFEDINSLPPNIQEVINKYELYDSTYEMCKNLLDELVPLGYTFEYYLDAIPYNLTKIKTK